MVYRTNFNSQCLYLNADADVQMSIRDINMALKTAKNYKIYTSK